MTVTVSRDELSSIITTDGRVRRAFERLIRVGKNRRHSISRLVVSVQSALDPLGRANVTNGIERSWSELTQDERARFLASGLDRECILLERHEERVRAQTVDGPSATVRNVKQRNERQRQRRVGKPLGPNDFHNYLTDILRGVYDEIEGPPLSSRRS